MASMRSLAEHQPLALHLVAAVLSAGAAGAAAPLILHLGVGAYGPAARQLVEPGASSRAASRRSSPAPGRRQVPDGTRLHAAHALPGGLAVEDVFSGEQRGAVGADLRRDGRRLAIDLGAEPAEHAEGHAKYGDQRPPGLRYSPMLHLPRRGARLGNSRLFSRWMCCIRSRRRVQAAVERAPGIAGATGRVMPPVSSTMRWRVRRRAGRAHAHHEMGGRPSPMPRLYHREENLPFCMWLSSSLLHGLEVVRQAQRALGWSAPCTYRRGGPGGSARQLLAAAR